MSFNVAMLKAMRDEGLDLDACIRVCEASEKRTDPTNAARQAKHRQTKRNAVTVTRYPPYDNSSNPPEELPQEANASLPQGAKRKREAVAWPCPAGVKQNHWDDFLAARKRKRCVSTQTALDGVLTDIAEIADDEWPPGRLVEHAAAKGWASINDPRKPMNGQANGKQQQPDSRKTNPTLDILRAANAEIARSEAGQDYRGTWPALPSANAR